MKASPRRWRRWLWRLLLAALLLRLLLAVLLLPIAAWLAGRSGLTLTWRCASLSLSGLSCRVEDLVVGLAGDDGPPLFEAADLTLDLSSWQLLHGELAVVDAALDSARVRLLRRPDGSWRLPPTSATTAAAPATVTSTPATPFSFALPLLLASVRIHDLQVEYDDTADGAPVRRHARIDLDADDLGHRDRAGTVRLWARLPGVVDEVLAFAELRTTAAHLDARWHATVRGVPATAPHLPPALRQQFGTNQRLDAALRGTLAGYVPNAATAPRFHGELQASLELDGEPQLALTASAGEASDVAGGFTQPVALSLHGKDLVDHLQLSDASITVAGQLRVSANVAVRGLGAERFAAQLRDAGVTLPAAGVDLTARLTADLGAGSTLRLDDLELHGGDATLLLPRVEVRDLRQHAGLLAITAIEVVGPELTVRRADDAWWVAGIRFAPPPPPANVDIDATAPAATSPAALPRLRLDHFTWRGAAGTFVDTTLQPKASLTLRDVAVQLEGLVLGAAAPPARWSFAAAAPGVVDGVRLDGELTPAVDRLALTLRTQLRGITAAALAPWLQPRGITPTWRSGTLEADAEAELAFAAGGLRADFTLSNLRCRDGDDTHLRLRRVRGQGIAVRGDQLDLGRIEVDDPFAALRREPDGGWSALGLHFLPTTATRAVSPAAPTAAPTPTNTTAAAGASLTGGHLTIRSGGVQLHDARHADALLLAFGGEVVLGGPTQATTVDATVRVEGAIDELQLRGTLQPGATPELTATLAARGLRGPGISRFLPAPTTCDLEQGELHAQLTVAAGHDLAVSAREIRLSDRGAELMAVDAARLRLPAAEPGHLHIAELRLAGVRTLITRTAEGLRVPGLLLQDAAPPVATEPTAGTAEPPVAPVATTAAVPLPLPLLRVDDLSIELERCEVRDRGDRDGEPLVLRGQLTLREPWAPRATELTPAPLRLTLAAGAAPLCAELTADLSLGLYELAPTLHATLTARGLDTTALTRVLPSLGDHLVGRTRAATFTTALHARIDLKRRDPLLFTPGRPFAGELSLDELRLTDTDTGVELVAIGAIDAVARAFDPTTGDLLLRSLDVDDVHLAANRTSAGLELLGITLSTPAPPAAGTPTTNDIAADSSRRVAAPATAPAPEFAVDRLEVQGLRLDFTDSTTTPVTRLPIAALDLDLQQFSTRSLQEPRPFRFHLGVQGGDIDLEQRTVASSALAGLVGSAVQAATMQADRADLEPRAWLENLQVSGELQLRPYARGQVGLTMNGLELPALRGLARTGGVDIGDGLYDLTASATLRGADGIDIVSSSVFNHLSLSEPPGGPISTYLKLPAPLDSVLFLLKNDNDEHRLPVRMHVAASGNAEGVADQAVEALALVIGNAITGAGGRAIGAVTGLLGLGTSELPAATLDFAAGEARPTTSGLDQVVDALAADPALRVTLSHELGALDLDRAAELATPTPTRVRAAIDDLRRERQRLQQERGALAQQAAALYAVGQMQAAWRAQEALGAADAQLGRLEHTLDATLDVFGGDTPRAARRRTRAAATELANGRLQAVRHELLLRVPGLAPARIELRRPRAAVTAGLHGGGRVAAVVRAASH
ncbi:MAG: DUF748 domain-containing protein [Planctomycetes bacterium]|nr:DUF748 domain-containing protein [Planctomycetota bacterium]